jgi:cytochrome c5
VATSYTLPIASTATQVKWPHNWWDPVYPTSAACLSCHDSIEAAAHALGNTVTFGEACAVCHKESADAAVSKAHAR